MDEDELLEKIINKELTICETCDNIFTYIPQKVFCETCMCKHRSAQKKIYHEKNRANPEWVAKTNARQKAWRKENREKKNARARARYHANKKNASK